VAAAENGASAAENGTGTTSPPPPPKLKTIRLQPMKSGRDDGEPFEVEQTEFEDWKNAAEKFPTPP